jgi:hypothetical protein
MFPAAIPLLLDNLVAITGSFLKLWLVHNRHISPRVSDHPRFMQNAGGGADTRPASAKHLT